MKYCERLKKARQTRGMTQQVVADCLEIPRTQLTRYERGINETSVHYLIKLCKLYNVSADYILGLPAGLPHEIDEPDHD